MTRNNKAATILCDMWDDIAQYIVEMLFDDFVSKLFYGFLSGLIVWGKSIRKTIIRKIDCGGYIKKSIDRISFPILRKSFPILRKKSKNMRHAHNLNKFRLVSIPVK